MPARTMPASGNFSRTLRIMASRFFRVSSRGIPRKPSLAPSSRIKISTGWRSTQSSPRLLSSRRRVAASASTSPVFARSAAATILSAARRTVSAVSCAVTASPMASSRSSSARAVRSAEAHVLRVGAIDSAAAVFIAERFLKDRTNV